MRGLRGLPMPPFFTAFDRGGELLIFNPPQDGAGNFLPLFIAANVRPSASGSLVVEPSIAGEIINGDEEVTDAASPQAVVDQLMKR